MIIIKALNSNIFDGDHDAIVIPVNRVGVAGKGLALETKNKFPLWYRYYKEICTNRMLDVREWFFPVYENFTIISFPTKNHWKEKSNIEYIKKSLYGFFEWISIFNLNNIGIPALGCGLDGLKWEEVKKEIIEIYENSRYKPKNIYLYPPLG